MKVVISFGLFLLAIAAAEAGALKSNRFAGQRRTKAKGGGKKGWSESSTSSEDGVDELGGELRSDYPSDVPSSVPSDFPSAVPSGVPSGFGGFYVCDSSVEVDPSTSQDVTVSYQYRLVPDTTTNNGMNALISAAEDELLEAVRGSLCNRRSRRGLLTAAAVSKLPEDFPIGKTKQPLIGLTCLFLVLTLLVFSYRWVRR